MDASTLDTKLRKLNEFEMKIQQSNTQGLKDHFSKRVMDGQWIINNEKLMLEDEAIAIHKHDRFVTFDRHSHDYLEMMFVYSGRIKHIIDNEELEIRKGEILLLDMNVEHAIEAAGENDIAINILIKKKFFDSFFMHQIAYNDLISNFVYKALYGSDEVKRYIYFNTSENDRIWGFMMGILSEYFEKRNGMETAVRAYMLLLFNELFRGYSKYMSESIIHQIESSISVEIMKYIDEHFKDLVLKEMAKHFGYSSDYLGKMIKKFTGRSLKDIVIDKKMEQAKLLLDCSDMTVTDVVAEVGYSNVSHFYKQFKAKYGVTPDQMRKTN